MVNSKVFVLIVLFVTIATNASATSEKSSDDSQKVGRVMTQQLELAQHFLSPREQRSDGEKINRILEQLNLSAQQSRQVAAIRKRFKIERDTLYQQVKNHRQEMRSLLVTNSSSDRLRQDSQETRSLLEKLGNNRLKMMMQIRRILTTEQRIQLIESIGHDRG